MTPAAQSDTVQLLLQAIAHFQAGRLDAAEGLYRKVLDIDSEQADALHLLGLVLIQRHDPAAAETIARAAALRPDDAEIQCNLGLARRIAGDLPGEAEAFAHAAAAEPTSVDAQHGLGTALRQLGRVADAVAAHRRAADLAPGEADVHNSLGISLREAGDLAGAIAAFERGVELSPELAAVWKNLGNARRAAGQAEQARIALDQAIALDPNYAEAHNDRAILLREKRRFEDAAAASARALELNPDLVEAYQNRAHALQQLGRAEEAVDLLAAGSRRTGDPGLAIREALVLPVLPDSADEIARGRARAEGVLKNLRTRNVHLHDPVRQVGATNFYMAYQGLDDRRFQSDLAGLYLDACPELAWNSPETPAGGERVRLGIASAYLHPGHTIAKLCAGLIEHLPRDRLEVVLIRPGSETDAISESADDVIRLPRTLTRAREAVAAARLDALLYTDIGMDPLTYFLAFARLAPLQLVTWGHPVTTGIPNLDVFLSTLHIDTPDDQDSYSEELVRLPALPVHYTRPTAPDPLPDRAALGLPVDRRLYVCTQTLFKIHPDFDAALAEILRRDPDGTAVFIAGAMPALAAKFEARLRRAHPDVAERLLFLDFLSPDGFLGLCAAADVLLDTFHFSGGNTSFEAFSVGAPVVTLPSEFLRGRFTTGLYREMGIDNFVARTPEHYVDLALATARDQSAGQFIADARDRLFENRAGLDALADFVIGRTR